MKRTTIVLPPELKTRAIKRAKNRGISLGKLIREALETTLKQPARSSGEDPFFSDKTVFRGRAPRDLSKNHDKYLYGD